MRGRALVGSIALTLWLAGAVAAVAGAACYDYKYAPNLVRAVQELLKEQELYSGPVDGKWGRLTERAVYQFQRRERIRFATPALAESNRGQLDDLTLAAMFRADAPSGVTVVENPHNMPSEMWSNYCRDRHHFRPGGAAPPP
jgi:hypothetical protein